MIRENFLALLFVDFQDILNFIRSQVLWRYAPSIIVADIEPIGSIVDLLTLCQKGIIELLDSLVHRLQGFVLKFGFTRIILFLRFRVRWIDVFIDFAICCEIDCNFGDGGRTGTFDFDGVFVNRGCKSVDDDLV